MQIDVEILRLALAGRAAAGVDERFGVGRPAVHVRGGERRDALRRASCHRQRVDRRADARQALIADRQRLAVGREHVVVVVANAFTGVDHR